MNKKEDKLNLKRVLNFWNIFKSSVMISGQGPVVGILKSLIQTLCTSLLTTK